MDYDSSSWLSYLKSVLVYVHESIMIGKWTPLLLKCQEKGKTQVKIVEYPRTEFQN